MFQTVQTYSWGRGKAIGMFSFGVFLVTMGVLPINYWLGMGPSVVGWIGIVLYELLFVGVGILAMFYRQTVSVDPVKRQVNRQLRFATSPFKSQSWNFSDFSSVNLGVQSVENRGITTYSASITLALRSSKALVYIDTYNLMFKQEIPEKIQALGN